MEYLMGVNLEYGFSIFESQIPNPLFTKLR